jgi:hypothetical protein
MTALAVSLVGRHAVSCYSRELTRSTGAPLRYNGSDRNRPRCWDWSRPIPHRHALALRGDWDCRGRSVSSDKVADLETRKWVSNSDVRGTLLPEYWYVGWTQPIVSRMLLPGLLGCLARGTPVVCGAAWRRAAMRDRCTECIDAHEMDAPGTDRL